MSGIRLSEKYGVNLSLAVCFFCGMDNGTIILPRKLRGDVEAPRRAVWNQEPCDTCKEWMVKGVILISVRKVEESKNPYRTGNSVVVTDDFIRCMVKDEELQSVILKKRMCYIPDDAWDALGLPRHGQDNGVGYARDKEKEEDVLLGVQQADNL